MVEAAAVGTAPSPLTDVYPVSVAIDDDDDVILS